MTIRQLFVGLACASFEHETVNLEFAIASANRLKPAFVVITGDLINDPASAARTCR